MAAHATISGADAAAHIAKRTAGFGFNDGNQLTLGNAQAVADVSLRAELCYRFVEQRLHSQPALGYRMKLRFNLNNGIIQRLQPLVKRELPNTLLVEPADA